MQSINQNTKTQSGKEPGAPQSRRQSPSTSRSRRTTPRATAAMAVAIAATLAAASCGGGDPAASNTPKAQPTTVRLVTHGSFALSEEVLAQFTEQTGLTLEVLPADDAGAMVNQLILTKDAPLGDAVFGIDNTFASRAVAEGLLQPYTSPKAGPEQSEYTKGLDAQLTAIDFSDVCVNADLRAVPDGAGLTFDSLLDPALKDQLVVENPATSSPGLAFLLATIAAKGQEGYLDYWRGLMDNGAKVVSGWNEAYHDEFSGPSSVGQRALTVSYATSPPSEIPEGADRPATAAALGTCFRQVEYAGVLKGAANPGGAQEVVDFLLSDAVQADIPGQMWVYPVSPDAPLPPDWVEWAPLATDPWSVSAEDIAEGRERWLAEFNDQILG